MSVLKGDRNRDFDQLRRWVAKVHLEERRVVGKLGAGSGGLFEDDRRSCPFELELVPAVGVEQSPHLGLVQLEEPGFPQLGKVLELRKIGTKAWSQDRVNLMLVVVGPVSWGLMRSTSATLEQGILL